jgi:hypothetical protein
MLLDITSSSRAKHEMFSFSLLTHCYFVFQPQPVATSSTIFLLICVINVISNYLLIILMATPLILFNTTDYLQIIMEEFRKVCLASFSKKIKP